VGADQKYIVKPLSAGEGIGIKLLDDLRATVRLVLSCLVLSCLPAIISLPSQQY
jgi:hypothetical protein